MSKELVDTIKEMYLFLSEKAETVGMLPYERPVVEMSRLEFEYRFLPRLIKVKVTLALMFWMAEKGYASY